VAALTRSTFAAAIDHLAGRDPDIGAIVDRCGKPPFWSRPQGFATLVLIVLEQQVSLASARATFDRLLAVLPELAPEPFLLLSDAELRAIGFSRQKTRYAREIARAIEDGSLPLARLARRPDDAVRSLLTAIKGVGDWTADVYLMTALRRADLWPLGDLALVKAICQIKQIDTPAPREVLLELGESYRPYRSVAARLYWHHYLTP
jgi:DNA-3-methyladenine glycosylase II